MAPLPPGAPRESPKPQPIGNMPMIILFTTCMLCVLFILWRRADTLRKVVSHQLKTLTRPEGRIRLSEDDGPPAREFLEDDYDEDHQGLDSAESGISAGRVNEAMGRAHGSSELTDVQGESTQSVRAN
ncbi:hypothetical protein BDZ94DRAFT_1270014 [Collybia nuda]|uniref:Uncharacterized protein n=1 Tax=Collybia nuda TaxID=64659 RepID=A0A9P6CAT4_9AGAR|nr:hypothetical protein BDZ94DRAFT_1270014 [Collybia nuda]